MTKGFTLVEVIISVAIIALVIMAENSFLSAMFYYNSKAQSEARATEGGRRVMEIIAYETRNAKSVYTPTTSQTQLSLETRRYLYGNETVSYIDFFLCGASLCFKAEGQDPFSITPNEIKISNFQFSQIGDGAMSSVKISLTASYKNSSAALSSSALLRSY